MTKLFIQIDGVVREMTDDEQTKYLEMQANAPAPLVADNDD